MMPMMMMMMKMVMTVMVVLEHREIFFILPQNYLSHVCQQFQIKHILGICNLPPLPLQPVSQPATIIIDGIQFRCIFSLVHINRKWVSDRSACAHFTHNSFKPSRKTVRVSVKGNTFNVQCKQYVPQVVRERKKPSKKETIHMSSSNNSNNGKTKQRKKS